MAGPNSKDATIPEWQRKPADTTTTVTPEQSSSENATGTDEPSKSGLLDQAAKFLDDESIRDAPTDRKIAFLESKGLHNDDIQRLLGVSRNTAATGDAKPGEPMSTPASAPSESSSQPEAQASSAPSQSSPSSSPSVPTPSTASRDVPPIITYPEFLLQPSRPSLITLRGVLYTLYGAAGLGASLYGASELLVKPMVHNLTSARHELAETTQNNLQKLNEKLEQNVSKIPLYPPRDASSKSDSDGEDTESITSDPTELFHRDIATQTTPDLDGRSSGTYLGLMGSEPKEEYDSTKVVTSHLQRLEVITTHLREFVEDEKKSKVSDDAVRDRLSELQTYLDSLTYSSSSYLNNSHYNIYGGGDNNHGSGSGRTGGIRKGEEDAISTFKAEIRGVKGALLSARNFPSSRPGMTASR